MNTLGIFLEEFWPIFIGTTFGLSLVWLARRSTRDTQPPFINRKGLPELSGHTEEDQRRLVHEASREAFSGWRCVIPIFPFTLIFSLGTALVHMLPKVTSLPKSIWLLMAAAGLCAVIGAWVAGKIEAHFLRPILKRLLAQAQVAA